MKMEYKLIEVARKGFILTREPEVVTDELIITFTGAPNNATAIFENGLGDSLYRLLNNGVCSVPAGFLTGVVKCTVAVIDGAPKAPKFICESIYIKHTNGGVVCCPDGVDIPLQMIETLSQVQDIKNNLNELAKQQKTLSEKLDKLIEGYDFE